MHDVYNPYYRARLAYGDDVVNHQYEPPLPSAETQPQLPTQILTQTGVPGVIAGQVSSTSTVVVPTSPAPGLKDSLHEQLLQHIQEMSLEEPSEEYLQSLPLPIPPPPSYPESGFKQGSQASSTQPKSVYTVPTMSAFGQLDVALCQLTALFTARNGRAFLNRIAAEPEGELPEMQFLQASHPLFTAFQRYLSAYQAVVSPSTETLDNLQQLAHHPLKEYLRLRLQAFQQKAEQLRAQKLALAEEEETFQVQLIDWHNFSIVETLTFDPAEDMYLPEPEYDMESIERTIAMRQAASYDEAFGGTQPVTHMEIEAEKPSFYMETIAPLPFAPLPTEKVSRGTGQVMVEDESGLVTEILSESAALSAHKATQASQISKGRSMVVCPNCQTYVPEEELDEHMRIELLDPRWQEQHRQELMRRKETNEASGAEISAQLMQFQRARKGETGEKIGPVKTFHELLEEQNAGQATITLDTLPELGDIQRQQALVRPSSYVGSYGMGMGMGGMGVGRPLMGGNRPMTTPVNRMAMPFRPAASMNNINNMYARGMNRMQPWPTGPRPLASRTR